MPRDRFAFHWENPTTEEDLLDKLLLETASIEELEAVLDRRKIPIRREGPRIHCPFTRDTIYKPQNASQNTALLKAFAAGYLYCRRQNGGEQ